MRTTTRFLTLAGAALVTVAGYSTHARAADIKVAEGYYNFRLTERLRLSFHLQHVLDSGSEETSRFGYFLPGVRLHASF